MSIERVRTLEEILRELEEILREAAAFVDDNADHYHCKALADTQRIERNMVTQVERRLAIEVAAGELAQALLRRRLIEMQRAAKNPAR